MSKPFFEIPPFHDYVSPALARKLLAEGRAVSGVPDLVEIGQGGGLETHDALKFLTSLYDEVRTDLATVLNQRVADRKFIDERVQACFKFNQAHGRDILDPDYQTILGLTDGHGRIVIGPKKQGFQRGGGNPVAPLPDFLQGPHVTLFGPPDSAKMAINAMNAYHRKTAGEPAIVAELLGSVSPMWGADDEDSKTPLRSDLVDAAVNLTACFDNTLSLTEGAKTYELAKDHLALPIKRFPGLALPTTFLFYRENPIPLHLYDFALHLYHNWRNPRALVFYVPKLENEEEATYIQKMVAAAERRIKTLHPSYQEGTVRLMIVLENPRAILRAHEIIDALHPYFAGASLGWHDYLASTARVFKEDGNYRIPVKADPGIVIKYIKASHHLLAEVVGSRGGIRVGGMYGILPVPGDARSQQMTLKGFIKDVVTQLKRKLNGFWVAHPDFVRIGLALVEAWRRHEKADSKPLRTLVTSLLNDESHREILAFIEGPDIEGLDPDDPSYVRSLLVADIKESDFIANNHPDEIRYNVFQSLQYLADWLSGNGCVALPTHVEGVGVRVMDDLATAERSRWEVWHELHHGRFSVDAFIKIAHEEMNFIRRGLNGATDGTEKTTQVKWDERTSKWYPIALKLMLKLMTDPKPVEFATELLLPFTVESIRSALDPWAVVQAIDSEKFKLEPHVAAFNHAFEICGSLRFAQTMAEASIEDLSLAKRTIMSFSIDEIKEAAGFHGNIGDNKKVLDIRAAEEQRLVLEDDQTSKDELSKLGFDYLKKFGVKFLISAQGKSSAEIKSELLRRIQLDRETEIRNARISLWEISLKRLLSSRTQDGRTGERLSVERLEEIREKHGVREASISVSCGPRGTVQNVNLGEAAPTVYEIASLSKTVASVFALEYFARKKISLTSSVNSLFAGTSSKFRLHSKTNPSWADRVHLTHLLNHTALNMHYVNGFPTTTPFPPIRDLVDGGHGYVALDVVTEPGTEFRYSGGGFLVLEHLIESLEGRSIQDLTKPFFESFGFSSLTFDRSKTSCRRNLDFPAFAAGAFSTTLDMHVFLQQLTRAYNSLEGSGPISHDTAVTVLHAFDRGAREFMGCEIGLGVFVAEAGPNRWMIHQGANEGFRCLYAHCFKGPDQGKGVVLFARGDNAAVPFIAEAAWEILRSLETSGIEFGRRPGDFETKTVRQEQIVNFGYKTLLLDAFQPDLPEEIIVKGPLDPLAGFNLATRAKILATSNQKFARAENLISKHLPIFDPELFGRQGKVMDSWESARHNPFAFDWLTLELETPTKVRYVSVSTKYHDGNHAEFIRLEGCDANGTWHEVVPKTPFKGHSLMRLKLGSPESDVAYLRFRLEMHPDGGISRLGLYDELPAGAEKDFTFEPHIVRFPDAIPKTTKPLTIPYRPSPEDIAKNRSLAKRVDWASAAQGGRLLHASNEHYGPAAQVISPYPPIHMFDGLESARSRKADHHEEVTLQLGRSIKIRQVEIDFKFFVNNNPMFVSLDGWTGNEWIALTAKTPVKAFAGNQKRFVIQNDQTFEQIKVKAYPDGGIHRVKVFE